MAANNSTLNNISSTGRGTIPGSDSNKLFAPITAFDAAAASQTRSPGFVSSFFTTSKSSVVDGGIGSNPSQKISSELIGKTSLPSYNFPLDIPRYHFGIIECNWEPASKVLTPVKQYRLPLPMPLVDQFAVAYDANFNYFSAAAAASGLPPLSTALAAAGLTVNSYKGVTLGQSEFRRIQFQWKLSPRNAAEAEDIRQITYQMRAAMTPAMAPSKFTFEFPRIFVLYFFPNSKYLYKFKPVVLEALTVDYAGGNPIPSFYQGATDITGPEVGGEALAKAAAENSPPESIIMSTNWLELEYWVQGDYKGVNGMPTSNEFDAWNYYKLEGYEDLNA